MRMAVILGVVGLLARRRRRRVQECDEVGVQSGQRIMVDIGHLARLEMTHRDVVGADLGRHVQVRDSELGRIERRGEIEVVRADEQAKAGVPSLPVDVNVPTPPPDR